MICGCDLASVYLLDVGLEMPDGLVWGSFVRNLEF